jgi:exopolysaccharide biosynthesis polyprenyl glycosylphosphotransferase
MVSLIGTAGLTILATLLANHSAIQRIFTTYVPLFNRLKPITLAGSDLWMALGLTVATIVGSVIPLFKPRPRRILDTITLAQKRVVVGGLALATIGYFQWSHRLPRATLTMAIGVLFVVLPAWFVWIRRAPVGGNQRAIVVGDNLERIEQVVCEADLQLLGYICPTRVLAGRGDSTTAQATVAATDGGAAVANVEHLGGLSRIEDVLDEYDIDTVVLAFERADRGEFFGALDACYERGVSAKIHRDHAEMVLTAKGAVGTLVDIEVEPWDVQDYMIKRVFDVAFAVMGLALWSPVIAVIAVAIKLDGTGPILYEQERTAMFGERFSVYKFRTMVTNAEAETGATISEEDDGGIDPRVTRVGRILRKTHLDELPQLWSILIGDMSVVGPRPERPELEADFQIDIQSWRERWFVKPGLTGLAQINDVTGHEPEKKLRYDLEYIRQQSFWFDLKIVLRQLWQVQSDAIDILSNRL